MQQTMTRVGLDAHARSTHAAAIDVRTGELTRRRFGADTGEVIDWLGSLPGPVQAVYEAGPTGFALYRAASAVGIAIEVIAPGKTARPPAERVKTDRRDAELLARLSLAGQLKPIAVPSEFVEGARHLMRARESLRRDLFRARQRVSKLLLLHGRVYPDKTTWTTRHRRWLASQRFDQAATELAFVDLVAAVDGKVARKQALDERLSRLALDERLWPTVARLRGFRGIDTLTALGLHLELGGDWQRFSSPRALFSWLGLTPSLAQSGESSRRGSITKTGSGVARRLLVESAQHCGRRPAIGATLANRQAGLPDHILQISWRAQHRLHRLDQRLRERGKPGNVVTVALARELSGFLWAAATAP
jgi:transposase